MKKIAILTNIIAPYRLPLFNGIADKCKLDILICKETEKNREWEIDKKQKFKTVKLRGFELTLKNSLGDYRFIYLKFSILFYLIFKRPAYLFIGDASFTSYFAALLCNILRIKYIWWNEILPFTPISKGVVEKMRRYSITRASHHFVSGTLAKEFIQNYGIEDKKISIIPDAVDNQKYFSYYQKYKDQKESIRKKYNISEKDFVFLYVGQFIERKNIDTIMKSFQMLHKTDKNVKLFLVGGGIEKEKIEKFVLQNHLNDFVIIEDFLKEEELSKIYTISNALLILSESEPWGMVVNEAMCFGLPVIASRKVGAGADLIDDKSGVVVEKYKDKEIVSQALLDVKMKQWSKKYIQEKVSEWNNDTAISNIVNMEQNKI